MTTDTKPQECAVCDGEGVRYVASGPIDCYRCASTGYADQVPRMHCVECGGLFADSDLRISPDHDGARVVCEPCRNVIELQLEGEA